MDTGLIEILSQDLITVANPFCKKKGEIIKEKKTIKLQLHQAEINLQQLSIASLCSPQFKRDLYFSEIEFPENKIHIVNIYTSRLSTIYLDYLSPPPKRT